MKYHIQYSGRFKKSLKKAYKRGLDVEVLRGIISSLENSGVVDAKYRPHKLSGRYSGCWECHVQPDWLLVWQQDDDKLILLLLDTGSHSDIFG